MKVLDLRCQHGHRFEGWFASEDDYVAQSASGLLACPLCADKAITRLPSAPRLNVSGAQEPKAPAGAVAAATPPTVDMTMQAAWLHAVAHVLAHTVDVGDRFAEEARRIHYREVDMRPIRGQATPEEAEALREEGIEVMSLPLPVAFKGPLQ